MPTFSCKDCVPQKRHLGCHGTCEEYLKEKESYQKQKEWEKEHKNPVIKKYDYDRVSSVEFKKRHKK